MSALLAGWLPVYAAPAEGEALADLGAVQLGVGKVAAAVTLLQHLIERDARARPAGVLLFGVCGAYPARHRPGTAVRIGDVVLVDPDGLGDEGAMTPDGFCDLAQLGLPAIGPLATTARDQGRRVRELLRVPMVPGTTVSTCSGTEELSLALAARTGAVVETMEGAAVALVCARRGVPLLQLRAVANWTGDRARAAWDLRGAVQVVQAAVRQLIAG